MANKYSNAKLMGSNTKRESTSYAIVQTDKAFPASVVVEVKSNGHQIGLVRFNVTAKEVIHMSTATFEPKFAGRKFMPIDIIEATSLAMKAQTAIINNAKKNSK